MRTAGSNWVRAAGAIWMLAFLIWLPFEDTETWMAMVLGVGGCTWFLLRWLALQTQTATKIRGLATGALLGAAAPLLTLTLMALKSGLHAHGFGDFTARQLWEVVSLAPVAILIGSAAGLVANLLIMRRMEKSAGKR